MNEYEQMQATRLARTRKIVVVGALTLVAGFTLLAFKPFKIVSAGSVGVQVTMGEVNQQAMGEGLHFVNPLSSVYEVNTRAQKVAYESGAASKDLQQVKTELTINYHVNEKLAPLFYQKLPKNYDEVIIAPAIGEVTKAVVAQYSAEELITKREAVSQKIRSDLIRRIQSKSFGSLAVDDVNLTGFSFSDTFAKAVEAKQEAEQKAAKAKNDLARIEVEAQQKVAMAKAEAEAIKIQADAVRAQGGAEYVQLKAIEKWDGALPQVSGGSTPFINLSTKASK